MIGHFIILKLFRMRVNMKRIFMVTVCICLFFILLPSWMHYKHKVVYKQRGVNLSRVILHIDFKGSPPRLNYLTSLLPMFKDLGVNGLLMEYEDMFPYTGDIINLSSKYSYKEKKLKDFIKLAWKSGFEIIPLVQTFGHMEHALKLLEFKHLREDAIYPDSICPSKMGSKDLINKMLKQIIKFHTSVIPLNHLHIGCDEVYHINKCAQCRSRGLTDIDIYMDHLRYVTGMVKSFAPNVTVLIWDDMFREVDTKYWNITRDMNNVEAVYWDYSPTLHVSHRDLYNYHKKFKNIWIASAFKGADGRTATLPDLNSRFMNNLEWLRFILDYKFGGDRHPYSFKGIILTGWSRYSHMDPLCEILPASIPSIVMNLLLVKHFQKGKTDDVYSLNAFEFFYKYINYDFIKYLQCDNSVDLDSFYSSSCKYEESTVSNSLVQFIYQNEDIRTMVNDDKKGLHSFEYYNKIKHINMNLVTVNIQWLNDSLREFIATENKLSNVIFKYHSEFVVEEYVHHKFYNGKRKLKSLLYMLKDYYKIQTWYRKSYN